MVWPIQAAPTARPDRWQDAVYGGPIQAAPTARPDRWQDAVYGGPIQATPTARPDRWQDAAYGGVTELSPEFPIPLSLLSRYPCYPGIPDPPIQVAPTARLDRSGDAVYGGPIQVAPTARLDRSGDAVYGGVTELVRAVLQLKDDIARAPPDGHVLAVKNIGLSLRKLMGSVDAVLPELPPSSRTEIEGTQRALNKELAALIAKLRLAQQNRGSSLGPECRRQMLAAAHALAVDAKNLLDAVDQARLLGKPCPES
ncbi:protein-tyrosine kinase 2-beta-like [Melozone crissalis]|uniref:protein-tyrosine kinase 2-beta-like n=1 Tax=Melozone crissalis TaxID=40204 RepID=UPI0023DBC5A7|nr:protein-tyrosine kinase 2-beta-like [Melozone crissalis]